MKHVVISIKSLHELRQITLSFASSYVPCCVKSCANLHQKACCFASSCNCTLLFLCCHLPFSIFFSDIFRFLFSCFLFFNPRFFQMFLTKYVLKFSLSYYQMSLISSEICKGSIPNGNLPRPLLRRGARAWSVFLGNKMNSFIS